MTDSVLSATAVALDCNITYSLLDNDYSIVFFLECSPRTSLAGVMHDV
jgi:hypothetical protein